MTPCLIFFSRSMRNATYLAFGSVDPASVVSDLLLGVDVSG